METVVSIFVDKTKKSRKIYYGLCNRLYGVDGNSVFSWIWNLERFFDSRNEYSGFLRFYIQQCPYADCGIPDLCVFVGFIVKPETITDEVESSTQKFKSKKLYIVLIKYVAPILVLLILFSSVLNALGIITL